MHRDDSRQIRVIVLRGIAVAAVLGWVAYLGAMFFGQTRLVYPGARNPVAATPPAVDGLEAWRVPFEGGEIEALFLPAFDVPPPQRQSVVIYAHGNGENTDDWAAALDGFRRRGVGVLLPEYPGYGRSTGHPSESSVRRAMDAAYDRLVADPRVDAARVFGFGHSLGGGAVCALSRDRPLRALILHSTFPSLAIFVPRYVPLFLMRSLYDNEAVLRGFPGPVLVMHGREDGLIEWHYGERLAKASPHAIFRLHECGHGCWESEHAPFWEEAGPFLESAGIPLRPAEISPIPGSAPAADGTH